MWLSLNFLGNVEVQAGNLAAARSLFQRCLDLREALAEADPHSAQAQRDLSISYEKLGNVEVQAGNLAAARSLFQRDLAIAEALVEADPHNAEATTDVVISHYHLANLATRQQDRASELDHLRCAHAILIAHEDASLLPLFGYLRRAPASEQPADHERRVIDREDIQQLLFAPTPSGARDGT